MSKKATKPPLAFHHRGHRPQPEGERLLQMPVRMSRAEREFLDTAAARVSRSTSAYIILAALEKAEKELGRSVVSNKS